MSFILLISCQKQAFDASKLQEPYLMVSHLKSSALTFIDLDKNEIMFSKDIRYQLTDLVSIKNGKVVATSRSEKHIFLIDLNIGTIEPIVKVNSGLTGIHYDYLSNLLFVADSTDNQIHIIDLHQNAIVNSVATGKFPTSFESLDQDIYVLNGESNDITVIGGDTYEEIQTFSVIERPAGMIIDNDILWVGGHGPYGKLNREIIGYDPHTGQQLKKIEVGLMPVAFWTVPSSRYLYVLCHGDHALYKVDKKTNEVTDVVAVGENPNFIWGNQGQIFVSSLDGNKVSIIDKERFQLITEVDVPAGPYSIIEEVF
ncbi:YncE family protein [Halalkalibacter krulwichiae]|uniref:YncE family protein n=1 Tax=Halalkalibacter krulwichiae TaxID=199441 RepID=UPI001C3FDEC3|nr:YncE family protein [Halalkalibacter krulwichiae]